MNWKLIAGFSSFGIFLGGVSILGPPRIVDLALRLAAGFFCAYLLARMLPSKQLHHGFVIGFAAAMLTTIVEVVFFDAYFANNSSLKETFDGLPEGTDPRQYLLSYAPVIGLLQGVALGVFSWTAANVVKGMSIAGPGQGEGGGAAELPPPPPADDSRGYRRNGKRRKRG
ncbi:MAG: hypothetical protein HY681_11050 [Chloroflexi bacterium]|nr:hypothetical protein [Chloroflexota bacterium]